MIVIDKEKCIGCGLCVKDCQASDIKLEDKKAVPLNKTCLKCGHCVAVCPQNAVELSDYDSSEIIDYNEGTFGNNPENILNSIKFRRSIRHFKDTPVERDKLEKIIEAGRFTPSGGNRQPLSFVVVQDRIEQLTELTLNALNDIACTYEPDESDPMDSQRKRYSVMWKMMHRQYVRQGEDRLFFSAPAVIIVLSDKNLSVNPMVDGGLAASNMQSMADALGLGVCFNGFFTLASNDRRVREFLDIDHNKAVVTSLVLGYTDNRYYRTVPRKKPEISWL